MRTLLALLLACAPVLAQDVKPRVDRIAKAYVGPHVLGMAVGIVKDGKTTVIGYGKVATDRDEAPTGATVYEIGSASKAVTGALLAGMALDGTVRLDQPLAELLPDTVKVPERNRKITLQDIATHTSGLPRLPTNMRPADPTNPYADYSVKLMYEFLSGYTLTRDVGAKYEYSNFAVGLLGHALARKAGADSYETLLIARIAGPLGMKDTRVALTEDMKRRLAPGYNALKMPAANWDIVTLAGAGGIRSTADDMVKFIAAHFAEEETPLKKALRDACRIRYTPENPQQHRVALGWHVSPRSGAAWHNGQTGGYHSFMAVHLEKKVGIVVLSNTSGPAVDQFGSQVMNILMGNERKAVEVDAKVLERYVGVYEINAAVSVTITLEKGRLHAQVTGQTKHPIFPESETKFFFKIVDAQITFAEGKLTIHQGGLETPATKKK